MQKLPPVWRRCGLLSAVVPAALWLLSIAPAVSAAPAGSIDFETNLTRIDGFGTCQAFQRAALMRGLFGLSKANQREVLDLLFSREKGAGLSILRLGVGSSPLDSPWDLMPSIQPENPGGPSARPRYVWDGYDSGQLWLAKEAYKYGVRRFYANPWSAPGYMKTNGSDSQGGMLCGVPGAECASGDWRQAYADYILQYVKFYRGEGIDITDVGFTNEPDFTAPYASMRFNPAQAIDFLKVFGPRVKASGLPLSITCCDATKWNVQAEYTAAIEADPVARDIVDIHTGHEYNGLARSPLPTKKTTWMSEYRLARWNPEWDGGSPTNNGLALANEIHDTLVLGNVNAYIAWTALSVGDGIGSWIRVDSPGPNYRVAKRLWAMAAYSRFIRPGAFRVPAESANAEQKISAFRNADGSKVINIINNAKAEVSATFTVKPATALNASPTVYVTDEKRALERANRLVTIEGTLLTVRLAPRSVTTVVLPPG
ncbi:MAG: glycoside hydrolase family 30 protein [bacterium]|jgi:O-glycosyl hydrolase